jgi:glycyl-radical enzyme activating protein
MLSTQETYNLTGLIFDVQGFSVHDGPGCRTLIFMKGCPLTCKWCCNPEGQKPKPQMMYSQRRCRKETYSCIGACPVGAISVNKIGDYPVFDCSKCGTCDHFSCTKGCYNGALRVVGGYVTVQELMDTVRRDRAYWGSGGGVTLGGGEPLAQPEFTLALLKELHDAYVHTAMETCANVPWARLEKALQYLDWIFVDIKHMDPEKHKQETSVTNELILRNIERIAALGGSPRMIPRMPVVPGYNDSDNNVLAMAKFLGKIGKSEVNLLPFHRLGVSKYEQLGLDYVYKDTQPPSFERMNQIRKLFEQERISCYVGSDTPF